MLGQEESLEEDPLEKELASHSSILALAIPCGRKRVGHNNKDN